MQSRKINHMKQTYCNYASWFFSYNSGLLSILYYYGQLFNNSDLLYIIKLFVLMVPSRLHIDYNPL